MRRRALLLLLLAIAVRGSAEDPAPQSTPPESPPTVTAEGLVSSTMGSDIATATYYELVAWCRQMGLQDTGSRKDLQAKLYAFYKIPPEPEKKQAARTIQVKSAKESEYFTMEEISQKYVLLRGDVVVVITDTDSGSVQEIKAQDITYNQDLNTVTATGGVEYKITNNGNTETFTGDSLSFDVDTGEGVFYGGGTEKPQIRGSQTVTFTYQGETISRFGDDTVVMDNGGFTSCTSADDPHYQVRASRVWILGPGEWALENAVLFVGHIPLLYLPFFFYPGDQIVFNPSIGYDDIKGQFLQTTTYLIGRKKEQQNDTLSFMQLSPTGAGTDYDQELHGIFLHKIPITEGEAKKSPSTLKLELDGYSRLGVFTSIEGDFSPLATFRVSLAESRSIFSDPLTGTNTPYFILPDGTEVSFWNESSIFGLAVPLRFGIEGQLSTTFGIGSITAHFQYYSDPLFTKDFYKRSEGFQFTSDLETLLAPSTQGSSQPNLSWDFTSRMDFSQLLKIPGIQSLSIPSANARFAWQSRETPTAPGTPLSADPGRMFYFPSNLTAPDLSLQISGELLHFDSSQSSKSHTTSTQPSGTGSSSPGAASPKPDPGKGFHAPPFPAAMQPVEKTEAGNAGHFAFRAPTPRQDVADAGQTGQVTAIVSYRVQPTGAVAQTFDPTDWQTQQDVDFRILYGTVQTGGSSVLDTRISLFDGAFSSSLSLSATGNYRLHYNPSTSIAPAAWESMLNADLLQDQLGLRGIFQTAVFPLAVVPMLSASTLSYQLNMRLYQITSAGSDPLDPQFSSLGPAWDQTAVTVHSLTGVISLKAFDQPDTLALTAQLPPLAPSITGRLDFPIQYFRTYLQGGMSQTPLTEIWLFQPIIAGEVFQPIKEIQVSEELQFDAAAGTLDRSTSQISLWGFTSSFTAERMVPVDPWGIPIGTTESFLPSRMKFAYSLAGTSFWFWQNRIRLDPSLRTGWSMNLQKLIDNQFDFSLSFNLSIFRFLDLTFSSVSYNNKTYRYIPGWPQALGESQTVNPLVDLFDSFSFWNIGKRFDSNFKLRSLSISAVQHLHDWDLTIQYQGSPQLTTVSGALQYNWSSTLAIQVQWVAVPEVKARAIKDSADEIRLRD
jgi:lipopolysaccharide assembly outer membrane protein LptD (OstA)